jgi:hypothetical protein
MILMAFQLAAGATMHVGAVVVRPHAVTFEHGRIVVRAAEGVRVGAEGGRVRRARDGSVLIDPQRPLVRVVVTY